MHKASSLGIVVLASAVLLVPAAAYGQAREDVSNAGPAKVVPDSGVKPLIYRQPAATFDNGPLVTHPGGGAGGADASRLQNSSLLMSTLGFTASTAGAFRIADDFTVTAPGWTVNTVTFFGYQTGSTTTSTMNTLRLQIWNGNPSSGGAVIFGDTTTNRFASTAWSNAYRDTETTVANNQRPIMSVTSVGLAQALTPGTYFVDFQLGGTLASGPFIPPVTVLGNNSPCTPCNGQQWSGTAWAALNDTGSATTQDVKFVIDYAPLPVELQGFDIE